MAFLPLVRAVAESYMIQRGVVNMIGRETSSLLHLVEMNIALDLNSGFSLPFLNEHVTCWELCQLLDRQP